MSGLSLRGLGWNGGQYGVGGVKENNPYVTAGTRMIIEVSGHQHQWLAGGYDVEIGHFLKWIAWWLAGG